ncbi:hypothetical protein Bbelb_378800 [Branchiostoma belcheri]|nr:hypothetical protein Bbelb_378800 [Branchiostoma belcheri]
MWRAGRRRRQRQGFQGVVLPLRILEDNGISRTVRSVYRQDEPQVSSAAPTTTLQPTADNNDITSSCQQSADEPVPDVSRHQQKKEQEKEAWADRRDDLIQTGMKLATPPTDFCYYCEQRVTSPMLYCRDCGPLGIYCLTCFEMFHISPSLHRPLEWKVCYIYILYSLVVRGCPSLPMMTSTLRPLLIFYAPASGSGVQFWICRVVRTARR